MTHPFGSQINDVECRLQKLIHNAEEKTNGQIRAVREMVTETKTGSNTPTFGC